MLPQTAKESRIKTNLVYGDWDSRGHVVSYFLCSYNNNNAREQQLEKDYLPRRHYHGYGRERGERLPSSSWSSGGSGHGRLVPDETSADSGERPYSPSFGNIAGRTREVSKRSRAFLGEIPAMLSPDKKYLLAIEPGSKINIFKYDKSWEPKSYGLKGRPPFEIAFSNNDIDRIGLCSSDGFVQVWDFKAGEPKYAESKNDLNTRLGFPGGYRPGMRRRLTARLTTKLWSKIGSSMHWPISPRTTPKRLICPSHILTHRFSVRSLQKQRNLRASETITRRVQFFSNMLKAWNWKSIKRQFQEFWQRVS